MDKIKPMMETIGETTIEQAYLTYAQLKEEVKHWQEDRGSFWMERFTPEATPPYYPLVNIPEMMVLELWKRLNRVVGAIVSETVLAETWNGFKTGRPVADPKLFSCLQIALSGITQLSRETITQFLGYTEEVCCETMLGESASCPICGEVAPLSILAPPNGKRFLHCTLCGHEWPTKRVGCICCGREGASEQNYLHSEEFPGVELVACESCGQYFKELDLRVLSVEDYVWEDLRTLPLNYAAEQWLADHAKLARKVQ